ncbi:HNH endonuclease [Kitasatospora sp. NPDC088391]|uniref:HNH endonuclease n=1 Tax=Kitasatospora sp. NPDC088391 TaxID=3364074 RepID=UPI0038195A02
MTAAQVAEICAKAGRLRVNRREGLPGRHQPILLLWAIRRAAEGRERLTRWHEVRAELAEVLAEYNREGAGPTPEYPFLGLRGSGLWEVHGPAGEEVPRARGRLPKAWLDEHDPQGGLVPEVYALMAADPAARMRVADRVVDGYFDGQVPVGLMPDAGARPADEEDDRVPAGRAEPSRVERAVSRVLRDGAVAEYVKRAHDFHCQVCGVRLEAPDGGYAEGAHIRALGRPHRGPDVVGNVLCLCPNHHVLFDLGMFTVTAELGVVDRATGAETGRLREAPRHRVGREFLAYHREFHGGGATG